MAYESGKVAIPHSQSERGHSLFTVSIQKYLIAEYGDLRNAAKLLARDASHGEHQVSYHTARAWLSGRSNPSLVSLEILAARCPALAATLDQQRARVRELLSR